MEQYAAAFDRRTGGLQELNDLIVKGSVHGSILPASSRIELQEQDARIIEMLAGQIFDEAGPFLNRPAPLALAHVVVVERDAVRRDGVKLANAERPCAFDGLLDAFETEQGEQVAKHRLRNIHAEGPVSIRLAD